MFRAVLITILSSLVPSCAAFMINNPGLHRALADYNCRKGYSACRHVVEIEITHCGGGNSDE